MRCALLASAMLVLSGTAVKGQTAFMRETLRGVHVVTVTVRYLRAVAQTVGINTSHVQMLVEQRLREHGFRVVDGKAPNATPDGMVFVTVDVTTQPSPGSVSAGVGLWQDVTLTRPPHLATLAATWMTGSSTIVPDAQHFQMAADSRHHKRG